MIEQSNNLWAVIITAITVLGGSTAFRYYEKRARHRERDEDYIRYDYKQRIANLERALQDSEKEKDELRSMILKLTAKVAELSTTVDILKNQNK